MGFIVNQENSLPFIASRAGYDVWFGNFRGNFFSQGHKNPKMNGKTSFGKFWDFDLSHYALIDLPS